MANRAHVPKFGNWGNGENVLYTAHFDNARKGKNGKIMNPNDPNENPTAFPPLAQQPQMKSNSSRSRPEPAVQEGRGMARPQNDNRSARANEYGGRQNDQPSRPNPAVRVPPAADSYNKQNSNDRVANSRDNSRRPTVPQNSGPDRARIEQSPQHPYQANVGSRAGVAASPSWENKPSGNNNGSTPNRRPRAATVLPKFGDWDEKNPNAGAGYTQIFNVVREEKKQIAANVNTPQQETAPIRRKERHDAKMACCFL